VDRGLAIRSRAELERGADDDEGVVVVWADLARADLGALDEEAGAGRAGVEGVESEMDSGREEPKGSWMPRILRGIGVTSIREAGQYMNKGTASRMNVRSEILSGMTREVIKDDHNDMNNDDHNESDGDACDMMMDGYWILDTGTIHKPAIKQGIDERSGTIFSIW
jgi:hypothetical protein